MAPTTYQSETELSSVNSILGAIGQSPITRIYQNDDDELVYVNPEVAFVHQLLMETNIDVQNEGWVFNREDHYELTPNAEKNIIIPRNVLRMDISGGQIWRTTDVVRRDGKLYDKMHHTYEFEHSVFLDITWIFNYEDLPSVFKRYITSRASSRAAVQLVSNQELVKLLKSEVDMTRAACVEYECNQGDHTFFGWPDETVYQAYQPFRTLAR